MANTCPKPESAANSSRFDDPDLERALFRHGLKVALRGAIAQLIHHPPDTGRLEDELRDIVAKTYQIPHSKRTRVSITRNTPLRGCVRRYLAAYRQHGFEALLPKTRCDAGQPRVIDPAVIQQAIALREQQPGRTPTRLGASTPMIAEILKRDGKFVNPHTLDTHLRRAGKTRRRLRASNTPYKRFERDHVNSLWQWPLERATF